MLDLSTFTAIHTLLSLVALGAGVPVILGLIGGRVAPLWTGLFFFTAIATSATGFGFPFNGVILPSHILGVIALVVLAVVLAARYAFRLSGAWRRIYAIGMVASVYFLIVATIAQIYLKIPPLQAFAGTTVEILTQVAGLACFIALGIAAARGFGRDAGSGAPRTAGVPR